MVPFCGNLYFLPLTTSTCPWHSQECDQTCAPSHPRPRICYWLYERCLSKNDPCLSRSQEATVLLPLSTCRSSYWDWIFFYKSCVNFARFYLAETLQSCTRLPSCHPLVPLSASSTKWWGHPHQGRSAAHICRERSSECAPLDPTFFRGQALPFASSNRSICAFQWLILPPHSSYVPWSPPSVHSR